MKQVALRSTADIIHKIETLEKEVMDLRLFVLKSILQPVKSCITQGHS